MSKALIVVPCYNEAQRLKTDQFRQLATGNVDVLFVDDGSKDNTLSVIKELEKSGNGNIHALHLAKNCGKAEAVRQGLNHGFTGSYNIVGYADADLATPPGELVRLIKVLESASGVEIVMGSRVKMLGTRIDRKGGRHYLGRVFATFASLVLRIPVYDTQCGSKFFRKTESFRAAIEQPFISKWVFDVELISRLLYPRKNNKPIGQENFLEVPLKEWKHIGGSKLSAYAMVRAFFDLLRIYWDQPRDQR